MLESLLASTVRMAIPIVLAGMGLIWSGRAGIVNMSSEGIMLMGALFGAVGSYLTGNPAVGVLLALGAGAVMGLIFGLLVVDARANQIVIGVCVNLFATGFTTVGTRVLFGVTTSAPTVEALPALSFGPLSELPFVGSILFRHNIIVYLTILVVAAVVYLMFHTPLGLTVRSVGEYPRASDSLGINVIRVRRNCCIIDGALAGLAGAYLSLGVLNVFSENMVSGKGFIAMSALMFGQYKPLGVVGAAVVFGFGEALQLRLQAMGIALPHQIIQMIPYLLTVVLLAGVVGKASAPAAICQTYDRESGE